jgi:hypothetical protein
MTTGVVDPDWIRIRLGQRIQIWIWIRIWTQDSRSGMHPKKEKKMNLNPDSMNLDQQYLKKPMSVITLRVSYGLDPEPNTRYGADSSSVLEIPTLNFYYRINTLAANLLGIRGKLPLFHLADFPGR